MRTHLYLATVAALGALAPLGLTSCDPYYYPDGHYSAGVSGSYGDYPAGYASGYGPGWGYGHSNFSTSFFVSTGNPLWGYDPYCRAYYNYSRRCYYDPYLHGYYPSGYRPPIINGVPHPHGYRKGHCPPPGNIRNRTVPNYSHRTQNYAKLNHSWAGKVKKHDYSRPPTTAGRPSHGHGKVTPPRQNVQPPRKNVQPPRQNVQPQRGSRPGQAVPTPPRGQSGRQPVFGSAAQRNPSLAAGRPAQQVRPAQGVQPNRRDGKLPNSYNVPVANNRQPGRTPDPAVRQSSNAGRVKENVRPQAQRQSQVQRQAPPRPSASKPAPAKPAPRTQSDDRHSNKPQRR